MSRGGPTTRKLPPGTEFQVICPGCKRVRTVGRHAMLAIVQGKYGKSEYCRSCSRKEVRPGMRFPDINCSKCGILFHPGSGRTKKCPVCRNGISTVPRACPVCGALYAGNRNKRYCSTSCNRRVRENERYYGGRFFETRGWAEKECQLCKRKGVKNFHSHHVFGHPNHDRLDGLCAGCHDLVSKLARRPNFDLAEFKMLIEYIFMQRSGVPVSLSTLVLVKDVDLSPQPAKVVPSDEA